MSEPPIDQGTVGPSPADFMEQAFSRFMAAWVDAFNGGSVPNLESFLSNASEPVRATLRPALEQIHQEFHARLVSGGNPPSVIVERSNTKSGGITVNNVVASGGTAASATSTIWTEIDVGVPTTNDGTLEVVPEAPNHSATVDLPDAARHLDTDPWDATAQRKRRIPRPTVAGYEILGELGRGGMGVVYKARNIKLNRMVALKMVLAGAHAGQDQLGRFLIEAEAVAQLQHPNIVQIYEIGEHDGLPYFALEFVNGGSLTERIAGKPQSIREAAEMTEVLAKAIASAHQHNIIHRDLKPANILLTAEGQPKVTDFGLAKRLESDSSQTKSGTLMGTPSYMAPEQARGDTKVIGPPADVYAVGAILYELLTGRPPFAGTSIFETVQQVLKLEPVAPRQLIPTIPVDLETICLKCLQKEPHKRYSSAEALAQDLHHYVAGEPIDARPVSRVERLYRWCRRNPGVAALSSAVLGLLITVAVTSSVLLVKVAHEKRLTELARDDAREAEVLASANAERANENAKLATEQGRLAVNTLYTTVTKVQRQLREQPGNQKLRRELLTDAFAGLDKVVSSAKDSPVTNRTRAAAYQHMGDISKELGQSEVALKHYKECQNIIDGMVAADPENDVARWNLSVVNDKLGEIHHQMLGDGSIARDYYRTSLALRQKLFAEPTHSPDLKPATLKSGLANAYARMSGLSLNLGDPTAAWAEYQKYLELELGRSIPTFQAGLEAMQAAFSAKKPFPFGIALKLTDFSLHLNDAATARALSDSAMEISQEALRRNPESAAAMRDLASTLGAAGDLEVRLGNPANAQEHYAANHELLQKIAKLDPAGIGPRTNLAFSHYRLGTACSRRGATDEAATHFRECFKLRQALAKDDTGNAFSQVQLMVASARCGQHIDAARQTEAMQKRAPRDPAVQFDAAGTYALCSAAVAEGAAKDPALQSRYVTLAIEALTQAVANGYRDVVALETDPDLDAIRQDARFKELVEKIKK